MNLLSLIPGNWILPAGIGALLITLLGVQRVEIAHLERDIAQTNAAWSKDKAQAAAAAQQAEFEARLKEHQLASKVLDAQDKYNALQSEHERTRADLDRVHADNGKLRNDIATYARGSSPATGDTCTAERERATTLGSLLAEALQADAISSVDIEANADAVRALLSAWPK